MWKSEELQLPVLTTIDDPLSGTLTAEYTDIQKDPALDKSLFEVPAGFTILDQNVQTVPIMPGNSPSGGGSFSKQ